MAVALTLSTRPLMLAWVRAPSPVAAAYTPARRPNFDIYLPEWLARHNKEVFGTLFLAGVLLALARWRGCV